MRKKRSLFFIMILGMFLLASCGISGEQNAEELPELKIGGALYEPYFYRDVDGAYTGIDVEIAREACSRMGYNPVFVQMELNQRDQLLEDGTIDCMWSCLSMEERREEYLWAGPYLYSDRVVVVREDDDSIHTLSDLEGKMIAVQANSTSETIFFNQTELQVPDVEHIYTYRTIGEVFTALRKGYVDAIAGHEGALLIYTKEYPGEYRYLNMSIQHAKLGVAFAKDGDAQLAEQLTSVLQEMNEDGTIAKIIKQYGLDVEKNIYGGEES